MSIGSLYMAAALMIAPMLDMERQNKEHCEKLREEYRNLRNLPRKRKKREKKRILLEYSIFSHDILSGKPYEWA